MELFNSPRGAYRKGAKIRMEANPKEPSSVVWLDTELFGPLPLPADPALRTDTEAILARARELASRSKASETLRSYRTAWNSGAAVADSWAIGRSAATRWRWACFWLTCRAPRASRPSARVLQPIALRRIALPELRSTTRAGPIANVLEGFKREQGVKPLKQATPLLADSVEARARSLCQRHARTAGQSDSY